MALGIAVANRSHGIPLILSQSRRRLALNWMPTWTLRQNESSIHNVAIAPFLRLSISTVGFPSWCKPIPSYLVLFYLNDSRSSREAYVCRYELSCVCSGSDSCRSPFLPVQWPVDIPRCLGVVMLLSLRLPIGARRSLIQEVCASAVFVKLCIVFTSWNSTDITWMKTKRGIVRMDVQVLCLFLEVTIQSICHPALFWMLVLSIYVLLYSCI